MENIKKTNPDHVSRAKLGTSKRSIRGHAKSLNKRIRQLRSLTRSQRGGVT